MTKSNLKASLQVDLALKGKDQISAGSTALAEFQKQLKAVREEFSRMGGMSGFGDLKNLGREFGKYRAEAKRTIDWEARERADAQRETHARRMAQISAEKAASIEAAKTAGKIQRDEFSRSAREADRTAREQKRQQDQARAKPGKDAESHRRQFERHSSGLDRANGFWELRKKDILDRNVQVGGAGDMGSLHRSRIFDVERVDAARKDLAGALGRARAYGGDSNWNEFFGHKEKLKHVEQELLRNEKIRHAIEKDMTNEVRNRAALEAKQANNNVRFAREEERQYKAELKGQKAITREMEKQEKLLRQQMREGLSRWGGSGRQRSGIGLGGYVTSAAAIDVTRRSLGHAFELSKEGAGVEALNAGVSAKDVDRMALGSLRKYGGTIEGYGKSIRNIAGSDYKGQDVDEVFTPSTRLAYGGLMEDTNQATDAVVTGLKAWNLPANRASMVADKLAAAASVGRVEIEDLVQHFGKVAPTAGSLGVSLDDSLAMMEAASLKGIRGEQAATGTAQVLASLQRPASKDAVGAASRLGIKHGAKFIKEHGLAGILEKIEASKTKLDDIAKVFTDRDGKRIIDALLSDDKNGKGIDVFRKMRAGIQNSSGAVDRRVEKIEASDYGQLKRLQGELVATMTDFGRALMPVAREVMPEVRKGLEWLGRRLNDAETQAAIKKIWELGKELGPTILAAKAMGALGPSVSETATSMAILATSLGKAGGGAAGGGGGIGLIGKIGLAMGSLQLLAGIASETALTFQAINQVNGMRNPDGSTLTADQRREKFDEQAMAQLMAGHPFAALETFVTGNLAADIQETAFDPEYEQTRQLTQEAKALSPAKFSSKNDAIRGYGDLLGRIRTLKSQIDDVNPLIASTSEMLAKYKDAKVLQELEETINRGMLGLGDTSEVDVNAYRADTARRQYSEFYTKMTGLARPEMDRPRPISTLLNGDLGYLVDEVALRMPKPPEIIIPGQREPEGLPPMGITLDVRFSGDRITATRIDATSGSQRVPASVRSSDERVGRIEPD